MDTTQNKKIYGKMECLILWPTYIDEKGRTLGKTYEIKVRCYWEHHWGTLLGTYWEPDDQNMTPTPPQFRVLW